MNWYQDVQSNNGMWSYKTGDTYPKAIVYPLPKGWAYAVYLDGETYLAYGRKGSFDEAANVCEQVLFEYGA